MLLSATALALLITGCAQQTFTVQKQTGSSSTKTITHHFVSGVGRRKLSVLKFVAAQKMLLSKTQQTFVNGLLGFIAQAFILRWKRVCARNNCMVAHRYGQLYLPLIYFWVPSSCFCIIDQPLWGWNNPVQRLSASRGRLHYPRRRRWWLRTRRQTALMMQPTTDHRQHHHAEHHFRFSIS